MEKKFFIGLLLILFSGIVLGLPPTVDFTFTPTTPGANAPVTFTPIITTSLDLNILFWGFDTDGNTNYTRTFVPGEEFTDQFIGATGTDLNVYNPDYNFSGTAPGRYAIIETNRAKLHAQSTTASNLSRTTLLNNDINSLANDENFIMEFKFNDFVYTAGGANQGNVQVVNPVDSNVLTQIRFIRSAPAGAISLDIVQDGNVEFSGLAVGGDVFRTVLTRRNQNFVYDMNVFQNGVRIVTHRDVNFNSDAFRFRTQIELVGGAANADLIFDDLNISGNDVGAFVPASPISLTQQEVHNFTSTGSKTVCLTAGNTDGNTTACHSLNVVGNIQFKIYDENTHSKIMNASAVFNGTTYGSDVNGSINISTPTVPSDSVIEVYAPGYPSRFFTYYVDVNSSISDSLYLLDVNKGRNIEFVVRDINSVKYPNFFFRIIKDQNVVARVYTDSKALTIPLYLANLVTDYNFFVDINSTAGTNVFSYGDTNLQINIPVNEATLNTVTPFGVKISDLTSIDRNNLTTIQTFKIYPNTFHPYFITIDANALEYFPRYYNLRSLGGQTGKTLQPYMLRAIDGGIPATMIVKDSLTSLSLQYYLFEFYTDVNQMANVLVESPQTDSAGAFIFTTITGTNYFLKIYDPYGDLIKQGQFISSTSTQYFVDLFSGVISDTQPTTGVADINLLLPSNNFFFLNDSNNFGIRFITTTTGPVITSVNVSVTTGATSLHNETFTPTFPATTFPSGTSFDSNFSTSLNNINTKVIITLTTSAGNVTETYQFPLKQDSNPTISFPGFGTFCSNVGGLGCALIWLLIGIFISVGLRFNPIFGVDNNGMFWVMAMWTGVAAFIGLVPYMIGFIAILAGASYWAIRNRPIG